MMLKKLINSNVIKFVIGRYIAFGLNLVKNIIIAVALGPFYFGIFSFIRIIQTYIDYASLGTNLSLSTYLSIIKNSNYRKISTISSSVISFNILLYIILLSISLLISLLNIQIFQKYNFSTYIVPTILISAFTQFNTLYTNILRNFNKYNYINIYNITSAGLLIPLLFLYNGEMLLNIYLWFTVVLLSLSFFGFFIISPIRIKINLNLKILKLQILRGIPLMLYGGATTYLLLFSRTYVSAFYSVSDLGFFGYANSLAASALLGIQSVMWLFTPKLLFILSGKNIGDETLNNLKKIRAFYVPIMNIIVFSLITLSPIIFFFLKEYKSSQSLFIIFMLIQLVISDSFGFGYLITAQKKEISLFKHLLIASLISIIILSIMSLNSVALIYLTIAPLISMLYFNIAIVYEGNKLIHVEDKPIFWSFFTDYKYYFLLIMYLFLVFFDFITPICLALSFTVVLFFSFNEIKKLTPLAYKIISDNNILNK